MNKFALFITACLIGSATHASDLAKEKRWADQVVEALIDGDEITLTTDDKTGQEFLGIYTESSEPSDRAVIIMHGTGVHPDWQQVIQPLRIGLTEHGWNTLSIQMPILRNGAEHIEYAPLFDEVPSRARAAIKYLKESGIDSIVIIGHSLGASMASYFLSQSDVDIDGFIAIGMPAGGADKRMNSTVSLSKINLPVVDLYGSNDLEDVLNTVRQRAAAAKKAGNGDYTQKKVAEVNHFFDGSDEVLISNVVDWLARFKK